MDEHDDALSGVRATEHLVLDRPMQRLHRLPWLFVTWGLALVVCCVAAAFVVWVVLGQRIANDQADRAAKRAQVEQQITAQQKTNTAQAAQFEQLRETACALIQRVPPDAEINRQRSLYHCGPYLPPGSTARQHTQGPAPTTAPLQHQPGGPSPTRSATPRPTARPTPHPTPTPTPTPHPTPPPALSGPILCIPLLNACI